MLQTVNIQNFKSLKDVTVNLQKVNVLIGPNNSGKSNFLKGLVFVQYHLNNLLNPNLIERAFYANANQTSPITLSFRWNDKKLLDDLPYLFYQLELFTNYSFSEGIGTSRNKLINSIPLSDLAYLSNALHQGILYYNLIPYPARTTVNNWLSNHGFRNELTMKPLSIELMQGVNINTDYNFSNGSFLDKNDIFKYNLADELRAIKIYKPDPSKIMKENMLLFDKHVNEECSNLVAFLDNMRDEYSEVWKAIENDLKRCLPEFEGINFTKVNDTSSTNTAQLNRIGKKFGLRDKFGKTFWVDELSEGTIYFLALLAIIHQPDPPKILLLEEPEKGIHPRRIKEVMDLIFRLAEEKDIQVIITTHSTQVVDEFQDIPESVFVFDNQNGETKVKNLLTDIIEPDNNNAEEKGYPKLDFSKHTLGEHWAIGFLGGVPK